jgi:hypothetical protein
MISTLEINQFRGLEHVKFENLGRTNLIIGGNNTGKTSILEALALLHGNKSQLESLPRTFRVMPKNEQELGQGFWKYLVRGGILADFSVKTNMQEITGLEKEGQWMLLKPIGSQGRSIPFVTIHTNNNVSVSAQAHPFSLSILSTTQADPATVSELFNRIAPLNPDNETKLEDLLRLSIEPRLRRLRYAKPQGAKTHLIYVDLGEGAMLPFTQLGQAFSRTLQVYCEIFAETPKIILIDEIENGLYYEGMEDFWKGLMAVLEDQDVQLFATTHSRECMEAAQKAASGMDGDLLRFLRLDRMVDDPSKIVGTTFGKREMETAMEFNTEMR